MDVRQVDNTISFARLTTDMECVALSIKEVVKLNPRLEPRYKNMLKDLLESLFIGVMELQELVSLARQEHEHE